MSRCFPSSWTPRLTRMGLVRPYSFPLGHKQLAHQLGCNGKRCKDDVMILAIYELADDAHTTPVISGLEGPGYVRLLRSLPVRLLFSRAQIQPLPVLPQLPLSVDSSGSNHFPRSPFDTCREADQKLSSSYTPSDTGLKTDHNAFQQ